MDWSLLFSQLKRRFPCMLGKPSSLGNKKLLFLHAQIKRSHPSVINVFLTVEDSHGFLPVATVKQQLITNSRQPWHNIPLPFISWWNLLATFRPIIVNGGGGEPAMREEVNHDAENRERPLLHTGNDQFLGNKQTTTNGWASQLQISSFCARDWGFYQMGQKARTVITEEF